MSLLPDPFFIRRPCFTFFALLLTVQQVSAAVVFDASTKASTAGSTSLTFAHTISSGSNTYLVVGVATGTDVVSGVTYNGAALTLKSKVWNLSTYVYYYERISPSAGAHNVVISASASVEILGIASSYTGVDLTTPSTLSYTIANQNAPYNCPATANIGTNNGNVSRATGTITNTDWIVTVVAGYTTSTSGAINASTSANSTLSTRNILPASISAACLNLGVSDYVKTVADGTITARWNQSNTNWAMIVYVINAAIALPVELIHFNASYNEQNKNVDLDWITASEFNNDYFIIEKSMDANVFSHVLMLEGAGNSSTLKHYSSVDSEPLNGVSFYRLKQVDFNGDFSFSDIVSVTVNKDIFIVCPSYSSGHFTISLSGKKGTRIAVKVKNILGQEHYSQNLLLDSDLLIESINVRGPLTPGVYFVIASWENSVFTRRIMIR